MKKKLLSLVMAAAMVLGLAACGGAGADAGSANGGSKHIYILTASEDHGWTGSVATFAKAKAEEINNAGTYTAEVITATDAADQITKIEDILAKGEKNIAIAIQPMDDTVQSAIQSIADAGIPFTAFDRIIAGVEDLAVANVKGDNYGIGAGAAAYFIEKGLKPGDAVYVYEGDTSSVSKLRDDGFTDYLLGNAEFDGQKIADADKWTEDQVASAVKFSGAMNWSRSATKEHFESLMGDEANASVKWFYAEDDELAMGILEALNGGGISDSTKAAILANAPVITGCGGLDEYYEVLRGNSYQDIVAQLGGVMSVTYNPNMIKTTVQDLVDYLDGKDVAKDHVIKCQNVTPENVAEFESFK